MTSPTNRHAAALAILTTMIANDHLRDTFSTGDLACFAVDYAIALEDALESVPKESEPHRPGTAPPNDA